MSGEPIAKRLLVVDDEPLMQRLTGIILRQAGYEVEEAGSAEAALERLKVTEFDLVLTDLHLGAMRGDQLAAAIKILKPALPVILMTGSPPMEEPPEVACIL